VLSSITSAPLSCATAAIAGISGISKDCDPGVSTTTAVVFGLNDPAMPAPIEGS
jgi:hypothetical protein